MPSLKNDLYLRAALSQPVDMTPVWMMRQAGRYLPEYRQLRQKAGDFMALCRSPELACEATVQPVRRFAIDAAIVFSDILTIPDAMGLGLHFTAGEGPKFEHPVRCAADVARLVVPDMERSLGYVTAAIRASRRELDGKVPLIGFSGSPWTLATYMVEGGASKDYRYIKGLIFDQPKIAHQLLNLLADAVAAYLNAQVAAGAQALMIFDTWGGVLSPRDYRAFSLAYMTRVIAQLTRENEQRRVPVTLFTKGGGQWLEDIAASGCDCVGVDWTTDLDDARARIGDRVALQGNMDPSILYAGRERIEAEVATILAAYGPGAGHVFNLGHGIHQYADPERAGLFIDMVHRLSAPYHCSD